MEGFTLPIKTTKEYEMALVFSAIKEKNIKVISRKDEVVSSVSSEDFDRYLKTLDESILAIKEGDVPTYFHLKTVATREEILAQKDNLSSLAMKAQQTGKMPLYTLMYDTVKTALKDITTGEESQMVKGTNGLASEQVMTWIAANDMLQDLYTALEGQTGATDHELTKKK